MEKITISADGKIHKEKWDWATVTSWNYNRLLTREYILLYPSIVRLGDNRREFHIARHDIPGRRLVYEAGNGHSVRIYY